ncbi:lysine--tRNA ligase [Candidatus Saccharibacteria bacterium]|nr:lysine--tRNA ligase [Candidatus Saccharibacteria bacterium]
MMLLPRRSEGKRQVAAYTKGQVKLDWRIDWPARWWLQKVQVEPFGRDHATKGGSYETGAQLIHQVFESEPPLPVPYDFINMAGDTKKMSASKGTGLDVTEGSKIMPPEVVRYFILRAAPSKRLYFDPVTGVVRLMDEFAALAAKPDRTESEEQLLYICTQGQKQQTVSTVPFSQLVASYQASLKDAHKTLEVIKRTEHSEVAEGEADIIRRELAFVDAWLAKQASDDIKFSLLETIEKSQFTDNEKQFFKDLATRIETAPKDADGEWFHQAIYDLQTQSGLSSKALFSSLYRVLIGRSSGPRAGWFLSILPRDWLIKRLKLEA